MINQTKTQTKTHKVRTFFAAIAGIVAIYLILASITVIWLNQTLTNTSTYVSTVTPLVTKPAIQNFISQKVTTQLLSNAPVQNLATALLPASELNGTQTTVQLEALLKPVIESDVLQIVQSPSFSTLWINTNKTAHAQLISQLNNNSGQITLDLSPAINGVISELKATQLGSLANKINVSPNAGKLDIKSSSISKVHHFYKLFQEGTVAIVIVTILAIGLSIWLSVHHAKTARRILFGTAILSLVQALLLEVPRLVTLPNSNQATQAAAKAFIEAIFHNLQIASLVVGVVCLVAAVGSKLYVKYHHKAAQSNNLKTTTPKM